MKLPIKPIAKPAPKPVIVPRAIIAPRPVASRPLAKPALVVPLAKGTVAIPEKIKRLALSAEENRQLQNAANKGYESGRKEVSKWMEETGTTSFQIRGEVNGTIQTVLVTYENTAREKLDLNKLLEVTGLTLEEIYGLGILSTTKKDVINAIGAGHAAAASVPGNPSFNANFKAL